MTQHEQNPTPKYDDGNKTRNTTLHCAGGIKQKILNRIDFLSDHWIKGDDRPPFNFGGWRDEVADELVDLFTQSNREVIEECIKLSDKIELGHETKLEEWKAFKQFRNTLRDKFLPEAKGDGNGDVPMKGNR